MKATNLMPHNWVMYGKKKHCCYIVSAHTNQVMLDNGVFVNVNNLRPIPLTRQVLENLADAGWCNYDSFPPGRAIYHLKTSSGDVAIYVEWERVVRSPYIEVHGLGDTFFKGYISSVHEFQNMLKLCRVDIKINI